jgi:hypothetical protein
VLFAPTKVFDSLRRVPTSAIAHPHDAG